MEFLFQKKTIYPINIKDFTHLNLQIENIEATLLYAKIKFQETYTKIKRDNKKWIVRSRQQISDWFNIELKKTDRLLKLLETKGYIEKKIGSWYGKKHLFLRTIQENSPIPINFKIFSSIISLTSSISTAFIYSVILFKFQNSKINHLNLKWCTLKKETLVEYSKLSTRTLDTILSQLSKKGLLIKKNFVWKGKRQNHYHIPDSAFAVIQSRIKETEIESNKTSSQNYRSQQAKKGESIKIRTKIKEQNNNNNLNLSTSKKSYSENINFIKNEQLTSLALKCIETATEKTIKNKALNITNKKELLEEIKFSLKNTMSKNSNMIFLHALNRNMKILANGNWKVPYGFYKYSNIGTELELNKKNQLTQWQLQKEAEIKQSKQLVSGLNLLHYKNKEAISIADKLIELKKNVKPSELNTLSYIKILTKQLDYHIQNGADKNYIMSYLRQNEF